MYPENVNSYQWKISPRLNMLAAIYINLHGFSYVRVMQKKLWDYLRWFKSNIMKQ